MRDANETVRRKKEISVWDNELDRSETNEHLAHRVLGCECGLQISSHAMATGWYGRPGVGIAEQELGE